MSEVASAAVYILSCSFSILKTFQSDACTIDIVSFFDDTKTVADRTTSTFACFIETKQELSADLDIFGDTVASLTVTGILDNEFGLISAMDESSKYFVFTGIDSLEQSAIGLYYYLLFSDYSHLTDIKQTLESFSFENVQYSIGNNSYSMRKLSEVSEFVTAVLILISILCLIACIAFLSGAVLLKFARNRSFYYAAFSVGFSKGKLALSFLFEFLIVALLAFLLSVPICIALVNALSRLMVVFVGMAFPVTLRLSVVLYALIPIFLSAMISVLLVRLHLVFEK